MRDFVEYVRIDINPGTDLTELEEHMSMNGYHFGIDKNRHLLFVYLDELDYVETILEDRYVVYDVNAY
jgi:hypothetical protein